MWSACVFGVGFAALAPRVCPTVALVGDSPELVAAGVDWGVAHAPGYPLFVSMLHLASRVPVGEPAWRANLTSALLHALTVALVFRAVRRMTGSIVAALTSALMLLLARTFAFASLYAEVFPLNDLFFACLLELALPLGGPRSDTPADPRASGAGTAERRLAWIAFVSGLAVAHHPTIALAAPALAILVFARLVSTVRACPARLARYAGLFAAPFLLSYALVLAAASRHPLVSWGEVHDLRSLAQLVTRADYGGPLSAYRHTGRADLEARVGTFALLLWRSARAGFVALAAAGAVVLGGRAPRQGVALVAAFLCTGPLFALVDGVFQIDSEEGRALAERFVAMPLLPLAILGGAAALPVEEALRRLADTGDARRSPSTALSVPLVVAVVLAPNVAGVDLSRDRRGDAYVHDLLRDVPDGSLVLLNGDVPIQAGQYACSVARSCGRRMLVAPGMLHLDWYRAQLARRWTDLGFPPDVRTIRETGRVVDSQIARRPVFLLSHVVARDPDIAVRFTLEPSMLLLRVLPQGEDATHARFLGHAAALAAGLTCEGCAFDPRDMVWPSFERQTELQYESAIANHANFAREIGVDSLAAQLQARRDAMASATEAWESARLGSGL